MRKWILFSALMITMTECAALAQAPGTEGRPIQGRSPAPPPPGPLVDLVQAGVDAYNNGVVSYFEKAFADDILWVDEDGHELTGKMFAMFFITRQMTATPKRKMSVHNVATGTWGDTAWAAFAYTIDDGINKRTGMTSILFRKSGNDWKTVLIHGSINAFAIPH